MADGAAALGRETKPLIDGYGRRISYLRLSVTDRCDLRCAYCMPERAVFKPKSEVLSLEELESIAVAFVERGVTKIRLTGGEPLVRRNIMHLVERLGRRLKQEVSSRPERCEASRRAGSPGERSVPVARGPGSPLRGVRDDTEPTKGLAELTLTTNGTQLAEFAPALRDSGVRRINVSLDTLDRATYAAIAKRDALDRTLDGIDAALAAGLSVKINTVALKDRNLDEIPSLIEWAHGKGMELTLIEVMPMGDIEEDRVDQYAPLLDVRRALERRWTLSPEDYRSGGPASYVRVKETGGRLGFIAPLTGNFCDGCNRMRVTCTGELYMCLGQEARVDLKSALRGGGSHALSAALHEAMARKPKGHDFAIARGACSSTARVMAATGG